MLNKILIGTPVYEKSIPFLESLFITWAGFPVKGFDYLIVINGAFSFCLIKAIGRLQEMFGMPNLKVIIQPTGYLDGWGALTKAQNTILQYCRENAYSHLLFHEVSRRVTATALHALIKYDKPVIGCLYQDTYNPGYYCVYDFDPILNIHDYRAYFNIHLIETPTLVFGVGFGFTLIKADILKNIQFRSSKYAADTYFFFDLHGCQIPVYVAPHFIENLKITSDHLSQLNWETHRSSINSGNEYKNDNNWHQRIP